MVCSDGKILEVKLWGWDPHIPPTPSGEGVTMNNVNVQGLN